MLDDLKEFIRTGQTSGKVLVVHTRNLAFFGSDESIFRYLDKGGNPVVLSSEKIEGLTGNFRFRVEKNLHLIGIINSYNCLRSTLMSGSVWDTSIRQDATRLNYNLRRNGFPEIFHGLNVSTLSLKKQMTIRVKVGNIQYPFIVYSKHGWSAYETMDEAVLHKMRGDSLNGDTLFMGDFTDDLIDGFVVT